MLRLHCALPGTAIVLTTPDANRTFLSYLGEAHDLHLSATVRQAVSSSRIFVVEGYMWEAGNALATIGAAAAEARRNSAMVVLTAGDVGVVQRHTQDFWQTIQAGVDILFCNKCVLCSTCSLLSLQVCLTISCHSCCALFHHINICKIGVKCVLLQL